jgi:BirA family biotin operon repressor/biotin-[acetyl-CoA-carboxylase] ligase
MLIIQIDKTDSSNRYARDYIRRNGLDEPMVFAVKEQTAGKGQGINSWHSQRGKNITCSFAFKPKISPENQFMISQAVSLGIIDFLEQYSPNFKIKWPNDIYRNDKKIAGILIENTLSGNKIKHCIAGVGININQTDFPKELPNPNSLSHITGKVFQVNEVLPNLIESIEKNISGLANDAKQKIENQYLSKLYRYKQKARYKDKDGEYNGMITGIDSYGRLLVRDTDKKQQKKYDFKEIVFL